MDDAKETGNTNLSARQSAVLADESPGVVVDTHRANLVESMELVKINRTIVIDHHRRTEGALPNTVLSYMESYASSASELVRR